MNLYSSKEKVMAMAAHLKDKLQDFSLNSNWKFDQNVKHAQVCSISTMRIA